MKDRRASWLKAAVAFIALAFCAAPVPGDVGGCGQSATQLDPQTFFWSVQQTECDHCTSCGIGSDACTRACGQELVESEFPDNCVPLVHDGEVCLRALDHAGCADYRQYMSDRAPTVPTECNFCPRVGRL